MSEVLVAVLRLLHRTKHYFIDDGINRFAVYFFKHSRKIRRTTIFGFPLYRYAESIQKRDKIACFFCRRFFVYAVYARQFEIIKILRDFFVAKHHKLFDNLIRVETRLGFDVDFSVVHSYVAVFYVEVYTSPFRSFFC